MPGTRPRADAFSASTGRPPRSVTKSSWRCSATAGSCAILRRRSASFPRPSRSSRRRRRSDGEAESFRSEPSSSTARPISSATESSAGSIPATSSISIGISSRSPSARRAVTPARIVRSICASERVSSVLPRAARSAASLTSAAPPRSGSAASSSSEIASVVSCWRARPRPHPPTAGGLRRAALPARLPLPRPAGPGPRGARAARGRALAWGECTAEPPVVSPSVGV